MNKYEFYYYVENDEIAAVDTENVSERYTRIEVKNKDELLNFFSNNNYKYNEEIEDRISTIFDSYISNKEPDKELEEELNFKIKHWVSNRSFGELIDMFENKEIIVPDMQRPFVWDSVKCSRLIESIIIGLPIPPLFLLEVNNNIYEIIDGYQRLTTLYNFVKGYPWSGKKEGTKRNVKARLSKNLEIPSIQGKTFDELDDNNKRIIRRSTIPLIEFKQLNPDNYTSKYLIFERINTGSEKLSNMQIRKSLAYGSFIKDLYDAVSQKDTYLQLFSIGQIKKDIQAEAFLRILAVSDIVYGRFKTQENGLENILNIYCENNRNSNIDPIKKEFIFDSINELLAVFDIKNIFKRVGTDNRYEGLMNISILEAMIGTIVECKMDNVNYFISEKIYKENMKKIFEDSISGKESNPFSSSTGTIEAMKKRFSICEVIIGRKSNA